MAKNSKQNQNWLSNIVDKLLHARWGIAFRGLVGILIGYAFVSRAFDTGSWIQYFCSILFFILGFRLFKKAFLNSNGKTSKTRKTR